MRDARRARPNTRPAHFKEAMASLLRFLGMTDNSAPKDEAGDVLQPIAQKLEELPPDRARFFAAFAYLLARIAGADLKVRDDERGAMEKALQEIAGVSADEAALTVEIASTAMEDLGGSHNFLVAREFGEHSTGEERLALLRCLYTVAAADGIITGDESLEITNIGEEIGLARTDVVALRSEFRDKLAEFRKLPGESPN
ncbi:MAG: TerB family tellurite resistance protein [Myxococcota bacterium]|nr:TerB family tellurite resistance protein [Myxococcota bacterium]